MREPRSAGASGASAELLEPPVQGRGGRLRVNSSIYIYLHISIIRILILNLRMPRSAGASAGRCGASRAT